MGALADLIRSGADPDLVERLVQELAHGRSPMTPAERKAKSRAKQRASRENVTDEKEWCHEGCDEQKEGPQTPKEKLLPSTPSGSQGVSDASGGEMFGDDEMGDRPDADTPEKKFFQAGKALLGPKSGGVLTKLLAAYGGDVGCARASIQTAASKENAMEYVNGLLRNRNRAPPSKQGRDSFHDILRRDAEDLARMQNEHEKGFGNLLGH